MNPRFTLLAAMLVLIGGGLYLWLAPPRPNPPAIETPAPAPTAATANYVLAVSWQPAFCETRPNKPECQSQTKSRFDASHFTLHGLWPQDADYCAVPGNQVSLDKSGDWFSLPKVSLAASTRTALDSAIPGTQSALERHEWIKHGTCSGATMNQYFARSLDLLAAINASPVRDLFATRIGKTITIEAIQRAFDSAFGAGAGNRVRVACDRDGDRRLITELTIGLYGDVMGETPPGKLIQAASPVGNGCDSGEVDAVGLR